MPLVEGTRVGVYEVLALLGSGGMGAVYRARDTRLDRAVALKILPDEFASDPDRLMRFEREAKTLAALNHPNIAQIHGLEVARDGVSGSEVRAIVMELVEGVDLSQANAVAMDDVLRIGRQLAEGLEAAHEVGVVHRDLKPANVRVRTDGAIKILDFGLAKPSGSSIGSASLANSPTMVSATGTAAGTILGTAAYMSPEQAKGAAADKRSDIWSFGVVMCELLSGKPLFGAETVAETLAAVLTKPIDTAAPPPGVHPRIRELIERCLERDPKRRLRDVGEARLIIDDVLNQRHVVPVAASTPPRSAGRWAWVIAAAAIGIAAGAGLMFLLARDQGATTSSEVMRIDLATPETADPFSFALSPDGHQLAFIAADKGMPRLWVRNLQSGSSIALESTDGAGLPFWSPDGRDVAFFADGKLKRMELSGGRPITLAEATSPRGGSWSAHGEILFSPNVGGIERVSAEGGATTQVTRVQPGDAHRGPHWLPDGRRFLYYIQSGVPERRGTYLATPDRPNGVRIVASDSNAALVPPNSLLYVKDGSLVSQALNADASEVMEASALVARDIAVDGVISSRGAFASSEAGLIAYRSGLTGRRLIWIDPKSGVTDAVSQPFDASATNPAVSPDGRRLVLRRTIQGNDDLWIVDLARGVLTRFTSDPAQESFAQWSPDGRWISFRSNRKGAFSIFVKPANAESEETLLLETGEDLLPSDWSRDGRWLLFYSRGPKTLLRDMWALPLDGVTPGTPVELLRTSFDEGAARLSPDGAWMAYQTNDSGRFEVTVRPFRRPGGVTPISTSGGMQPKWSPDGKAIYYLTLDGRLMMTSISVKNGSLEASAPSPIPGGRTAMGVANVYQSPFDIGRDGRILLIALAQNDSEIPPITLLLNRTGKAP